MRINMTKINETVVSKNGQGSSDLNASVSQSEKDLIYENMENELVQEILSALEKSSAVADSAKIAQQLIDKKDRLTSELDKLSTQKSTLIASIEELKKSFGSEDSIADVRKLKELSIELESIETAIPLLAKQLSSEKQIIIDDRGNEGRCRSELAQGLKDADEKVRSAVFAEMKDIQQGLQTIMEEKTQDIVLTYTAIMRAFSRGYAEQQIVPRTFMPSDFTRSFLPDSTVLEDAVGYGLPGGKLQNIISNKMLRELKFKNEGLA